MRKRRLKTIQEALRRIEEKLGTLPAAEEPKFTHTMMSASVSIPKPIDVEPEVSYTDPTAQFLDEVRSKLGLKRDKDLESDVSYPPEL